MSTITEIVKRGNPFGDDPAKQRVSYDIIVDGSTPGAIYPWLDQTIEVGQEVEANGFTAKGLAKFRIPSKSGGASATTRQSYTSSGNNDDKMRSKEQCMRGEAAIAAAGVSASAADIVLNAQAIYKYIESGSNSAPVPQPELAGVGAGGGSDNEVPF